jgi:hypothetical protein
LSSHRAVSAKSSVTSLLNNRVLPSLIIAALIAMLFTIPMVTDCVVIGMIQITRGIAICYSLITDHNVAVPSSASLNNTSVLLFFSKTSFAISAMTSVLRYAGAMLDHTYQPQVKRALERTPLYGLVTGFSFIGIICIIQVNTYFSF